MMNDIKITFEEIKDGDGIIRVITVSALDEHGTRFMIQEAIRNPVIFEILKMKIENHE